MAYFRCIGNSTPKYKKYLGQLIERVSTSTPKITSSGCDISLFDYYAFNGVSSSNMRTPNNCWSAIQNDDDAWIQYEFNRLYWFNKITIKCFSNYSGAWVGNIKILGSQNGIDWENILANGNNYELTAPYQEFSITEINLNSNKEYQFIKIQADNNAFTVYNYPSCFFDEIYVYGGVIASSELEDILTGVNNPSSDLGVDGQVYLKYTDYNSLYNLKEYIEVGSTAGAYINTGVNCTNTAYFEVDFNFTGSHSESRVFGCGTGGGAMFLIQNYNFDYMSAGGNSISNVYQIPDANNRHKYKANADGIYVDDVLVDTNVHWDNALPQRHYNLFAIDWDGTNYYATNARVYSCKIWTDGVLVRHFVPVKRKSDNVVGMVDLIHGIFYTNDGSGNFTVGGFTSMIYSPIITPYAKVNDSWQNLIGTDVKKIMSGQKYNYVVTGTFTTASIADTEVDVYCGFEPDIVYVEMEFSNGITKAIGYNGMNHSMWDLTPIEDRVYSVEIGTPGQTGISNFTSTGFKYNAHAGNTLNKNCTYCAIKLNPTAVDDYVTIKKVYMRVYPGQETTGDNLQFSDDGINWDVTVNYQQCNPRSNAVIVKDVLQVYYESPNWYIACASLFAKDENNNNYRMYDVMWSHHYNGIQPANFTGWIPNFLDE